MERGIFTVFDSAAGGFLDPFTAPTIEVAIRGFRELVNTQDHQFNRFPEDYTLFQLGTFNVETGQVSPLDTPHPLGVAVTYLKREVSPDA